MASRPIQNMQSQTRDRQRHVLAEASAEPPRRIEVTEPTRKEPASEQEKSHAIIHYLGCEEGEGD